MRALLRLSLATLALTVLPRPSAATWTHSAGVNLPVCVTAGRQIKPKIVEDGAGGAYVVWEDQRDGFANADIYAQHILADGTLDPAWGGAGLGVCTGTSGQYDPVICSDGACGAFVAWTDYRSGVSDVFAHHLLPSGKDPEWTCMATRARTPA